MFPAMFRLAPISDTDIWNNTVVKWREEAAAIGDEGLIFTQDIELKLDSHRRIAEQETNIHCYFLVKNGNRYASSVIEVSHACPTLDESWIKLLDVTLKPKYFPIDSMTAEEMIEAYNVLASSIIHTVDMLLKVHPAKQLKIYGRTSEMVHLFHGIIYHKILDVALDALRLSAKLEHKWLVLTRCD